MEDSLFMDYCEDLIESLKELEEGGTAIKEMYSSFRNEIKENSEELESLSESINKAISDGLNDIPKVSTEERRKANAILKKLNETIARGKEMEESIREGEDFLSHMSSQLTYLEKRFDYLESRIGLYIPLVDIDYEETLPAKELYNKYFGKIGRPLIIDKPSYYNEYCFRVDGISDDGNFLTGVFFQNGERHKAGLIDCNLKEEFKVFRGETLNKILANGNSN